MIETFTTLRPRLFGIAYRMLGRVAEAEDMVQETWLRWQRQELTQVASPEAWLVSTVTRLCIDQLKSARRQREDYYGIWLPEPLVEASAPSPSEAAVRADSLSMAFMLMLEKLTPLERAVFLLREVFAYDYEEIAAIVDKTQANCRQIVRRARTSLPQSPQPSTPPSEQAWRVVQQFLVATKSGELGELLALLTDDATLYTDGGGRVPSAGRPIRTADHVGRFFVGIRRRAPVGAQVSFVAVNGRPGALVRLAGAINRVITVDLDGERVRAVYMVTNPEKLRHLATHAAPAHSAA